MPEFKLFMIRYWRRTIAQNFIIMNINFKRNRVLMISISALILLVSCGTSKNLLDAYVPEESALNLQKITDETSNSVLGPNIYYSQPVKSFAASEFGGSRKAKLYWGTQRLLSISPDGQEIAYLSRNNKLDNVMIRKSDGQGAATQRTFRDVNSLFWGNDGNLYFSDISDVVHSQISTINAKTGSIMRQITSGNNDRSPVVTKNGKLLFFSRLDKSGPAIWSYDLNNGALTSCSRGYNATICGDEIESFICVRNNTNGTSEIWKVNFVKGQETLLLADKDKSFTNPSLSPDGMWIVCQGNSISSAKKQKNLDIFVVKSDGTSLTQLTYHPANDCSPVWSADGKYIYFISDRANKDNYYNIWKMRFDL